MQEQFYVFKFLSNAIKYFEMDSHKNVTRKQKLKLKGGIEGKIDIYAKGKLNQKDIKMFIKINCFLMFFFAITTFASTIIKVQNGAYEQNDVILSHPVSTKIAQEFSGLKLVEINKNGEIVASTSAVLDDSSDIPELVFLMPGVTQPNAVRRFMLASKEDDDTTTYTSNLDTFISVNGQLITVENSFYKIQHRVQGVGSLPVNIRFKHTDEVHTNLYLYDRIYRQDTGTQYFLKDDVNSSATIVFESPMRVVIETQASYFNGQTPAAGNARAKYRYIYTANSPVVRVKMLAEKDDNTTWNEIHFLHLTHNDYLYEQFVINNPPFVFPMQAPGTPSVSYGASQWAVMTEGQNAVGVGGGSIKCWDASSSFYYYTALKRTSWETGSLEREGFLYVGPTLGDYDDYNKWLNLYFLPEVSISEDDFPGDFNLSDNNIKISFSSAETGFDCVGILNKMGANGDVRFVHGRGNIPGLWKIVFKKLGPIMPNQQDIFTDGTDGQPLDSSPYDWWVHPAVKTTSETEANKPYSEITLTNRASGSLNVVQTSNSLTFSWLNLDLDSEQGVVDVTVTVELDSVGTSSWRMSVENRSSQYGVYETHFPTLSQVSNDENGTVLSPASDWGGRLRQVVNFQGISYPENLPYPSASCPVQLFAFMNDGYGLYFAAHDSNARAKRLLLTSQLDTSFILLAENAGSPGTGQTMDFDFVMSTYEGDWWKAAKLYREWATSQTWCGKGWVELRNDVSNKLKNLECWWRLSYDASYIESVMTQAEILCGTNIGLHWYKWHQIEFDTNYPDFFPARIGVPEAIARLVAKGMLIMPYINGRLWDSETASFQTTGFAGSCKKYYGGNYIEIYHEGGKELAPMCPSTALWENTIYDLCDQLINDCSANGIYIDQLGAAKPRPCYDSSHGHTLGGGSYWADSYRDILDAVKVEAVSKGCILTTENFAEPYIDNIDAFLTWAARRHSGVPLFPAIYSGYTLFYGSPQDVADTLEAFVLMQGRDFLFGCQLGWNGEWLLEIAHRPKLNFMLSASKLRVAAKDYMVFGELVDEIRPSNQITPITITSNRKGPYTLTLPSVLGTVWRKRTEDGIAIAMFNASSATQTFSYSISPNDFLSQVSMPWVIKKVTESGGSVYDSTVSSNIITRNEILQPHEIRIITIVPQ